MSIIRVETDTLINIANQFQADAGNVNRVGNDLARAGMSAHTYEENTFGPQVRAICNDASAQAQRWSGNITNLSTTLDTKVDAFIEADNVSSSQMNNHFNSVKDYFDNRTGFWWGKKVFDTGKNTFDLVKTWQKPVESFKNMKPFGLPKMSKGGVALEAIGLGLDIGDDYFTYKDEGAKKVTAAIAADVELTAINFAITSIFIPGFFAVGGGIIGSVVPGAGNVAGAAVGAKVGTVIGIAAKFALPVLEEKYGVKEWLMKGNEKVIDNINSKSNESTNFYDPEVFNSAASAFDKSLLPSVQNVTSI